MRINKTLSYMLFILGVFLISVGIYLSTYTTVAMIDTTFNYGFGNITFPVATQIQPYLPIGIVTILSGVAFIGIGLYETQKKPRQPIVPSPPPPNGWVGA
jgi:hypothetical protein